ncbi:enoyl-CoA hydratase [Sporobacter termitidis DSM 10068]|uniref:Enoyl-CoA hydratase n=2 Tax=Sporobacter TaxID=44748 RepID=A0A1M5Y6V1_9FIRM|nr:enoyl-CoA hydratase [Sporobacter termitidis DSM 10068]
MPEPAVNVKRLPDQPGALYIEFENPPMNQFTTDMWRRLVSVLRDARQDDGVRAVILSGAGDRAFSAGLAMEMLDTLQSDEDAALIYTLGFEVREALYALGKPVIAAVRGNCVGGGLEIALCCDLIYAAEGSKFMLPELNIGLVPGCGGAIHLAQKIPFNRAFEMILFSEKITAEEAKSLGLVNQVFPKESFDAELRAVVDKILSKPPVAVRALKELMAHANLSVNEMAALQAERRLSVDLMKTHDFKEAVSAFREKRTPVFTGK